jgi:molecular chaperone DnaK (HSP70)
MSSQYAIGIDLGTTNSALAFCALGQEEACVELLSIPQFVSAATIEAQPILPSFQYLATEDEVNAGAYDLPWEAGCRDVVGMWARTQSAEVPARTIVAAKSWLAHTRVDRRQPVLPWNAPPEVEKRSPVETSRSYLAHLAAAWNAEHPEAPMHVQQVVLTVPASFDASARELTREAALAAGLPEDLVLLEEPQAAVYAWLADRGERWRRELGEGDKLLICDVGGGTTDFTLIGVESEDGELVLKRLAVGDHILVGGDNMDLTLAHVAQTLLAESGIEIDAWQSIALWHACRLAKESLLSAGGPEEHPVTVLGRGSKLIGGTISTQFDRERVAACILDGFLPICQLSDRPLRQRQSGFLEVGLPFETDTAITRHLARFLSLQGGEQEAVRPTHVLLNGGVFKSSVLADRLEQVMGVWFGEAEVPHRLSGAHDLDFAVARGAAYYGFAKQGKGIRIRGGAGRSYYLGIETAGLAVPGAVRPLRALCVVPFGMEEGTETDVPSNALGLVVGEPAQFRFFSSTVRRQDRPGDMINTWQPGELVETDALETTLSAVEGIEDDFVPVRFHSRITELGMFELWCHSTVSDDRWKLEFNVRQDGED